MKPNDVRELSYAGAKEIDELCAGKKGILVALYGLPGVGKSVATENMKWDFIDLNRTKNFQYYKVVILDTDNYLTEAEKNGEIRVTRERADRAWEMTIAEYREIIAEPLKTFEKLVIIVPDAGSDVEKRTEIYNLAKENNFYIHSRYHRASTETAVEWNGKRLRKVDFQIMYEVYRDLETSWQTMHVQGQSFEIINVKRVDFEAVARAFSHEQLLDFFENIFNGLYRTLIRDADDGNLDKVRRNWVRTRNLLSWKEPILQSYQTQESLRHGLTEVMSYWATIENLQNTAWDFWKEIEKRPSVISAMAISEEAWGAIGKVSQKVDELRAALPKAYDYAGRVSHLTDDSKRSLLRDIVWFMQTIDEAQEAAQRAKEAQKKALQYMEDCKSQEDSSRREIPTDLDIFGASLEAGRAYQNWEDIGCGEYLDKWKSVLNQQLEVIQKWMSSQIWNDSVWNKARIELYGVLKQLELRL